MGILSRRFSIAILVTTLMVSLLFWGWYAFQNYQRGLAGLERDIKAIEVVSIPIATSVWYLDFTALQSQVLSISLLPNVTGVSVEQSGSKLFSQYNDDFTESKPETIELRYLDPFTDTYKDVGVMFVYLARDQVTTQLLLDIVQTLVFSLLQAIIIAAVCVATFQGMVGNHLRTIASHINNREVGASGAEPLTLPRQAKSDDELEAIVSNLNYQNTLINNELLEKERLADLERSARETAEEAKGKLEFAVADRTRKYLDAKDDAETANKKKSQFLAAASHDLRQPLQSIRMFLATIEVKLRQTSRDENDDTLTNLRMVNTSVDHLSDLLNALLDISKLEASADKVSFEAIRLSEVFDALQSAHMGAAKLKGLKLRFEPTTCWINSDQVHLTQILSNFISNAIRYTSKGTITVNCAPSGDMARIEVRDTGIGISEGALNLIFDEYYQVDNPARERVKGLGLGLSIVKRTADLLGHTVDVTSVVGKGSVFSLTLPMARAGGERISNALEVTSTAPRNPASILVVEDDQLVRTAIVGFLEAHDYQVKGAFSSEEAFTILRDQNFIPDILIADYQLPVGMSGLEFYSAVRTEFGSDLPGILISGYTAPDYLERFNNSGMHYLAKPVSVDVLLALIEDLTSSQANKPPKKGVA